MNTALSPLARRAPSLWQRVLHSLVLTGAKLSARALSAFGSLLAAQQDSGFAAARFNRLTNDWSTWRQSADQVLLSDMAPLRARSRLLVLNNPYAKRFINEVGQNVAGPHGFTFKPMLRDAQGVLLRELNQQLEAAWRGWCRKGTCTVDGRWSFSQLQQHLLRTLPMDGEFLVRKVRGFQNPYGFALQLLDADQLDETFNLTPQESGREVRMGVEIDAWGRPTTYWLWNRHPSEAALDRNRQPMPAEEIAHVFVPLLTGQSRGVPWMHPVMLSLRAADRYEEAELVAARVAASKMGFFRVTEEGFSIWQPPVSEKQERLTMEVEPGLLSQLPPGLEFQEWNPQHPNTAYDAFMRGVLRSVAAGVNVAYHNLTGDMEGVTYSSARIAELDERDGWRSLQDFVIESFLLDVYRTWLTEWLLRTPLALPSFDPEFYMQVRFLPRAWDWVDPDSELAAVEKGIQLGLTSRTREAAARGVDFEENLRQLAGEEQLAQELGVSVAVSEAPDEPDVEEEGLDAQRITQLEAKLQKLNGGAPPPQRIVVGPPVSDAPRPERFRVERDGEGRVANLVPIYPKDQ